MTGSALAVRDVVYGGCVSNNRGRVREGDRSGLHRAGRWRIYVEARFCCEKQWFFNIFRK